MEIFSSKSNFFVYFIQILEVNFKHKDDAISGCFIIYKLSGSFRVLWVQGSFVFCCGQ